MKFSSIRLASAALAVSAALAATAVSAQNLRYAHVGSEGDIQHWFAAQTADRLPDATDGDVTVTVFPNSQLGGVQETIDGVRSGAISMAHHEFASLAQLVEDIAVFNAPFVYRDGEHALKATDPRTSPVLQEFNEQLIESGNMRIIGRLFRGARQMTAKMPVYSPADLEGEPFRGVPLQLWTTMIKGFGAIPTPVEVSELPTALMTGMVVGQENPLTMINANKLYEVQSHVMLTGHMQNVLPVFINEDVWQSISEENREAILTSLDELAYETLATAQQAEQDLVGTLTEKGMTFITGDDGLELDAFREGVVAQVNEDFPSWAPYIEQIAAIE
ncbi:TRAP transporter substrate-binding protein [Pseudoponticoccus marisrubri]|uniref:TRAP dicarboxylate transporter subunit DctP n=1 Tax=Pseudoponticoccus marisrubri TaxID=1685382 RepID=A0A0W7WMM1_9RHOB|nr:TRAP transporter substrate-binding protein [Pseudoponticoccus marisrubri]KUF11837.1 TRAP dicarboxylate transporter subunit DctP [Pseudoponticoccus marisrubri]